MRATERDAKVAMVAIDTHENHTMRSWLIEVQLYLKGYFSL